MFKIVILPVLFLLAAYSEASVSVHNPFYCFSTDPIRPQNQMFATITTYESVRGRNIDTTLSTCTPRRFWMLSRGGTRLPNINELQRMIDINENLRANVIRNYNAGRTQLCRDDFEAIQAWSLNATLTIDRNYELHPVGQSELRGMAQRYQQAFPQALPATYNQAQYFFRHTYRDRTQDSAFAFAEGLFGHSNIVLDPVPEVDRLLRPIDDCPLYNEFAAQTIERDAFEEGPEFEQALEQINRKLGFTGSNQLSRQEVLTVWDLCRYELAWETTTSPWCAAFSIANTQVLEYRHDVYAYQVMGHGGPQPLFSNIMCYTMQNLLTFLNSTNPNEHLARIMISHSRLMRLFLVTLGAFAEDAPLTRHNFAQQTFRQWRSSFLVAKSSNFVVVQHECAGGEHELQILYNEIPLTIPGCEGRGFCRQSTFLSLFERFLTANCANTFCSNA